MVDSGKRYAMSEYTLNSSDERGLDLARAPSLLSEVLVFVASLQRFL